MQLEYTELGGKTRQVRAKVTTDHALSSYGNPVIVLSSGDALDYNSWSLLKYRIVKASPRELELMNRWAAGMPPVMER